MAPTAVVDPQLQELIGPWSFHFDPVCALRWPWEVCATEAGSAPEATAECRKEVAAKPPPAAADTPVSRAAVSDSGSGPADARQKERRKERKAERKGGSSLARGFLNRRGGTEGREPKATAEPPARTGASAAGAEVKGARRKKPPAGHYWSTPPQRYEFTQEREVKVEQWRGVEQFGELEKPTKAGICRFYRLPALLRPEEAARILAHCKQSGSYQIDPDSVDQTPTFEYYPFRDGEWVDQGLKAIIDDALEGRILPYIRERYDCRFCAVSDILVRRYIPGERRTHAVHFDGHAFVTAVLGLSSPEEYEGGLYLQPEASVASRMFFRIEPGDLVVHSFDLQHGVHVWKGTRYSLILWVKNSLKAVRDHSTPWYEPLAEEGDPDGLYNVAQNYEYGMFGKPQDINKAIELYERSAAAGHHFAQNNLGLIYRRAHELTGLATGLQKSFEWLKSAAEGGFAMAQKNLALAFANGQGVRRDDVQALQWMRRAAEQLEVEAAYLLGEFYRMGRGVPADAREAAVWCTRGAEAGFPKAQYTLGMLFLEGAGVEKDLRKAEKWLGFSGRQGHREAKNNLATLHAQRGDVEQAAGIWRELAEVGEQNAQCNLGMCYMRGAGRPQDLDEARRWLTKAAAQGHQMATQALMQLAAS